MTVGESHCPQHGPVAAETYEQVGSRGELVGGNGDGRATETVDLIGQAHDLHAPPCGPAEDRVHDLSRVTTRVEDQPERTDVAH